MAIFHVHILLLSKKNSCLLLFCFIKFSNLFSPHILAIIVGLVRVDLQLDVHTFIGPRTIHLFFNPSRIISLRPTLLSPKKGRFSNLNSSIQVCLGSSSTYGFIAYNHIIWKLFKNVGHVAKVYGI